MIAQRFLVGTLTVGIICLLLYPVLGIVSQHQVHADFLNPPDTQIIPPTNLSMHAEWINGGSQTTLSWTPSIYATGYNIYFNDVKIASTTGGTSYAIDPKLPHLSEGTYAVTAVDASGTESIPSAITNFIGALNPATAVPSWDNDPPTALTNASYDLGFLATPEWNLGKPRIDVTWAGSSELGAVVFKDGVRLPGYFLGNRYIDNDVQPGSTHTYSLAKIDNGLPGEHLGPQTKTISATALTGSPAFSATPVRITRVVPDDDSVKVYFNTVPGATDYRVYSLINHNSVKYAGSSQSRQSGDMIKNHIKPLPAPTEEDIEMNGLSTSGADLIVEAVDKLGPFQKADGFAGPGAAAGTSINGQGDPSDVPNVIARSQAFHVSMKPFELTGSQAFQDTFQNEPALQDIAKADINPDITKANTQGNYFEVKEQKNSKWTITQYGTDTTMTRNFFMSNHFMDTMYDGPSYDKAPFSHNNNASDVIEPNATADISDGKVLHVTMEVDAHFDSRRWVDVMVGGAGDPLLRAAPGKLDGAYPTTSGYLFYWEISSGSYGLKMIHPDSANPTKSTETDLYQSTDKTQPTDREIYSQVYSNGKNTTYANGSPLNLDNRSTFDLYLSKDHYKVVETMPDGIHQLVREENFPDGVTLPWDQLQVYYTQELYHTGNDINELRTGNGDEVYWYQDRPWSDERHWDNMGFDVLPSVAAIPTAASLLPVSEAPQYIDTTATPTPTSAPTPTPTSTPVISYDLNGDGKITLSDVVLAIHAYNGDPNAAALLAWPESKGNPGLQGIVQIILAYNQSK